MNSRVRTITYAALVAAAALAAASPAHSQQWPAKVVRVIVPFAPGGGSDITARQFSQKLSEALGQQFVVENRAGAGGTANSLSAARLAGVCRNRLERTVAPASVRHIAWSRMRHSSPCREARIMPNPQAHVNAEYTNVRSSRRRL